MALTRKMLSAMGIEADKVDQIIDAHTETVDGLKDELAKAKADAAKLPEVERELNGLKADKEKDGKDPWKVKYEALKEEYADFKKGVETEKSKAAKADAYRALLKECGVSEKRLDAVLRVTDLDGVELDENGKIKDAAAAKKAIRDEWADFIPTESTKGANTPNPPANNGSSYKTREEILAIKDTAERQAAWSDFIAAQQQKG